MQGRLMAVLNSNYHYLLHEINIRILTYRLWFDAMWPTMPLQAVYRHLATISITYTPPHEFECFKCASFFC